ncbi:MAG: hypothetical protein POELPBGB_03188 [Bacteroidia bacterium]|nr:hypothetical protein [Bacteroidia bacterium]
MTTRRISISLILFFLLSLNTQAQLVTQTIRGKIIDKDSRATLPGANIMIIGSNPVLVSATDFDGNFRIDKVPVGRCDIKITYIGYEDRIIPNIVVGSAKEIVLEIELSESLVKIEEVTISAKKNKAEVLNEMAVVSAKTFSVEETSRYAGALGDPARMVSAYAGVTGDATGNNDIVVRGNSSKGIQWRLEGVEIPNPNHFSDEGMTGGPINALNSAMLSNSDFFTGAFAPEYGNAYSGVFDMKLRTGNNQKREYSLGVGVLGIDFTFEGPFKKGGGSSYLANYRYSSLALLDNIGVVDFNGVPKYQDCSFKFLFPTKKAGTFSLFGLGGLSNINQDFLDSLGRVNSVSQFASKMGTAGLNHTYQFSDKTYLKSGISLSGNGSAVDYRERMTDDEMQTQYSSDLSKASARIMTTLHHKFNAKHKLQTGVIYTQHFFGFQSHYFDEDFGRMQPLLDNKGDAGMLQAFASWKYRITEKLTMVSGMHYTQLMFNKANSLEPRLALNWEFKPGQSINAGFGMHSRMEPLTYYFAHQTQDDGSTLQPNKNLGLSKARHYTIGYSNMLTKNLHLKLEAYYQELYNVPVENLDTSMFSALNLSEGWTDKSLVNKGKGRNYGLELTLEKFFAQRYFFLVTGSLYKSRYTPADGIERNSRFDGNFAANVLFGKEFRLGKAEKNRTLGISGKVQFIGGNYYTPVDLAASLAEGREVLQEDKPFSVKGDNIFQANLALTYRRDRKKTTHEVKADIQNITNNQAVTFEVFDSGTQKIQKIYQLSLLPVLSYKFTF